MAWGHTGGPATLRKPLREKADRKRGANPLLHPKPPPLTGASRGFPAGTGLSPVSSSSSGRDRTAAASAPPRPPWASAKPHRNAAGHMRCGGGGGRAAPPRPEETQRHLALTQLQKSQEPSYLLVCASAPKSCREAKLGPSPRAGTGGNGEGRIREIPIATVRVPHRPRQQQSPSSLLPLCLCNSLRWLSPHPLLQHEVIAGQSRRAQQNTSGAYWLPRPPLPLPTALTNGPGSQWGKKTETAISGSDPENKSRNCRVTLVGKPSFYFLAYPPPPPLFFQITVSLPVPLV